MARKSEPAGDIVAIDRGKVFSDLQSLKRSLRNVLRHCEEENTKETLKQCINKIGGCLLFNSYLSVLFCTHFFFIYVTVLN